MADTKKKKATWPDVPDEDYTGRHFVITRNFYDGARTYKRHTVVTLPIGLPSNPVTKPRPYWVECDSSGRPLDKTIEVKKPKGREPATGGKVAMSQIQQGTAARPSGA